jgi:hypothetical protein
MVANIVQGKSPIIKEVLCRCPVITLTGWRIALKEVPDLGGMVLGDG